MTHLSLGFLGGFVVSLDAEPVTAFGADKARALLAYLATEPGRPHPRAHLATMFWPNLDDKKAGHNLSQTLLRVRHALQQRQGANSSRFLLASYQEVTFNECSDFDLDVARFRSLFDAIAGHSHTSGVLCTACQRWLAEAAALYRGEFLAGLFVPDSVEFEEWRLLRQEELHRGAVDVLTRLVGYHAARAEHEQLQQVARRLIALEPWLEEGHAQLMRSLAQDGQVASALKQFEAYKHTLAAELGLQPAPDMLRLAEQIRAGMLPTVTAARPAFGEDEWLANLGERRQVTTLVCSRVRCTAEDDGPDEVDGCLGRCESVYGRFGGRRLVRQGDACLVLFGYPRAYEDAGARAVYAALAAQREMGEPPQLRISIHTGSVLIGKRRGPRWQDRDVSGAALEIARSLHRLAAAGQVLVTEDVRLLVQDEFEFSPLDLILPAGGRRELRMHRVCGERALPGRVDRLAHVQGLTPLVGRQPELIRLASALQRVRSGQGQALLVQGEPGIGKSRLLWELRWARDLPAPTAASQEVPPLVWFTSRCLPNYQNTSLYPIVGLLEQFLGFEVGEDVSSRRHKLQTALARYGFDRPSAAWLLSLLLGLPTAGPALETLTQAQRLQLREVSVALLQRRAAAQPLAILLEDLQWADPSTVEWLAQSLAALTAAPCLVLLTARPTFDPAALLPATGLPTFETLAVQPLAADEAAAMAVALAGRGQLDPVSLAAVVAKADGVPLYVEELTYVVLARAGTASRGEAIEIPATLVDSLIARLDRLGAARQTARWAAVLGREFSYPLLAAVVPFERDRLDLDLARLVDAELVRPILPAPQDAAPYVDADLGAQASLRYAFRHALVQEAAYASMLKLTRRTRHQRVAEVAETRFPSLAALRPEVMAYHYAQAGVWPKAVDFLVAAGQRALKQGATLEARNFFKRAREFVEEGDHERQWQVLAGLEEVFDLRGERVEQDMALAAMLDVADALDDQTRRAEVWLGRAGLAGVRGEYQATLPLSETAAGLARAAGNLDLELNALAYRAQTLLFLGDTDAATVILADILDRAPRLVDESVRALVLSLGGHYFFEVGDLVRAVESLQEGVDAARRSGNASRELTNRANLGLVYAVLGFYSEAQAHLTECLARAELYGHRRLYAATLAHLGSVAWWTGDLARARQYLEAALAEMQNAGDAYLEGGCLVSLGSILESSGDLAAAAPYLAQARMRFTEIGADHDRFDAQAVEARVALALGRGEEAHQWLCEVWAHLRGHGASGLVSTARIYLAVADVAEALARPEVVPGVVLEQGYRELLARAAKITDPTWRTSFLTNVTENRSLVERYLGSL